MRERTTKTTKTPKSGGAPRGREPRTPEELLEQAQRRALSGLGRSLDGLGLELSHALEASPAGRHPLLAGGAALALGILIGPAVVRGLGTGLRSVATSAERVLLLLLGVSFTGLRSLL